tara:strand:- start:78 stop:977 length:900 start_codon:yes stop_codon:yes gene_type:complete
MWLFFTLLSVAFWASVNVMDSTLVHKYEKNPHILMWFIGILRLVILLSFPFFTSLQTDLWLLPFASGVLAYFTILLYFYVLEHIDASVTQSAWAIESIFLSILGFAFLSESWSSTQNVGAFFILAAVFLLAHRHRHRSTPRTVGLLMMLALLGTPASFGTKYSLTLGVGYIQTLFWYLLGSGFPSAIGPLLHGQTRRRIQQIIQSAPPPFFRILLLNTAISFLGFATIIKAYEIGPLSLVAIAGNAQPFFVILFAWLLLKTKTTHVPKELLTCQSVQVKLACFSLMFVGLALLVVNGTS